MLNLLTLTITLKVSSRYSDDELAVKESYGKEKLQQIVNYAQSLDWEDSCDDFTAEVR